MALSAVAVSVLDDDSGKTTATLVHDPIMRYSAPVIHVPDAALWCFTEGNRPVALMKTESRETNYTCGVTSLCRKRIETLWDETRLFRSDKPGVVLRKVSKIGEAGSTPVQRLFQMKAIARRFSATFTFRNESEVMRLLPRPLYRYTAEESDIADGAIFAFTSTGTNPNAFVVIELNGGSSGKTGWQYGVARLTVAGVKVHLDDELVFEVPRTSHRRVVSNRPVLDDTYATTRIPKNPKAHEAAKR